ncbi:hypothetical protein PR048_010477 [Dryococelus australis]|uniref:Uncharacterized protein n=1 Tax=Dryococelus australis TaxID=614101 RepID=A0ABQ9I2V4_9NEOP|nr:hypothetical protein PR048_010477 [Dryococelus australis]
MQLGDVPMVLRKALSERLQQLRCAITGAIKYRESQIGINEEQRIRELCSDIHNGPLYVFGDHSKCPARGYLCKGSRSGDECIVPNMKSVGMWYEIISANNISFAKTGLTENRSESFNNTVSNFVDGKRSNFFTFWISQTTLANLQKKYLQTNKYSAEKRKKRHFQNLTKKTKRKINFSGEDSHYGSFPRTPDLNIEEYNKNREEFLKGLQFDNNKILNIQSSSTGQRHCMVWKLEEQSI